MEIMVAVICLLLLILSMSFHLCRMTEGWRCIINWFCSKSEDKVNLTRNEERNSANGSPVSSGESSRSSSELNLCHSGNFTRFDTFDQDCAIEMSDFTCVPTPLQPREQIHNYPSPENISLPFGNIQMTTPNSDDSMPPCSYCNAEHQNMALTPAFPSSVPNNNMGFENMAFSPDFDPVGPNNDIESQNRPSTSRFLSSSSYSDIEVHNRPSTSRFLSSSSYSDIEDHNRPPTPSFMYSRPSDDTDSQNTESTSEFVSSSPTHSRPSRAVVRYPPQPLRPAPPLNYAMMIIHEKYESEKPEKIKSPPRRPQSPRRSPPPKRPPPPTFSQVVSPPIPTCIQPPPLPPRRIPFEQEDMEGAEEMLAQIQALQRGESFESLTSNTSVTLSDLMGPHVTGRLCIGLDHDNFNGLTVTIAEGRNYNGLRQYSDSIPDTFVRFYLLPDYNTINETRTVRQSNSPSYKEKFLFPVTSAQFHNRTLAIFVYAVEENESTLIGEGELKLSDISLRQSVTTWITLRDTGQIRTEWGEIMLSLNYVEANKRLTVVVAQAKNLVFPDNRETGDTFVKVYLLHDGKKVFRKKTTIKFGEKNPVFNQAMIFEVPAETLKNMELRVTVAENTEDGRCHSLGHVIMGTPAVGKCYSHWVQMLSSPKLPISMWHSLAK